MRASLGPYLSPCRCCETAALERPRVSARAVAQHMARNARGLIRRGTPGGSLLGGHVPVGVEGGTAMRDPDLIARAQLAASALEGAWHRWRLVHGDVVDTMPAVSSYVGYSLHEPWGQPRVVFGLAAQDAEQLAALLERHGCVEPAYAAATTRPHVPDLAARTQPRDVAVPVPRRPSAAPARQAPLLAGANSGYDEPLYREVAAAMREAAGARESASRTKTGSATESRQVTDLVSPAWIGSLAMAASTARAEAEARIRAALTQPAPTQPAPTQPAPTQPAGEPAD